MHKISKQLATKVVDNEDIAWKLDRVHHRLRRHIERAKKCGDIPMQPIDPVKYAEESGASKWAHGHNHPVSFQKLLDIKGLFEIRSQDGFVGFSEKDFITHLGDVFCESQDPNVVTRWFMNIDQDANGYVDWDEFSAYLMQSAHISDTGSGHPKKYCSVAVAPELLCTNPIFVTKFAHNTINDVYYSAGSDGSVKCWDAKGLEMKSTVHYPDNIPILDLKYCKDTNKLLVLQADMTVFIYDSGGLALRQGHRLIRAFKLESMDLQLREKCAKGNFTPQYYKTVEFDPTKMALPHATHTAMFLNSTKRKEKRTVKTQIDVTLLDNVVKDCPCGTHSQLLETDEKTEFAIESRLNAVRRCHCKTRTIDHVQVAEFGRGLFPNPSYTSGGQDYYLLGTAEGYVALFDYSRLGAVLRPVALWQPHQAAITKMLATNVNTQLQGVITSSFDRTVQVLDVEKGTTYLHLEVDDTDHDSGGRGVRTFDYAPIRNLLVTIGFNRGLLIWDPLARRNIAKLSDHKKPIIDACFCEERNELITMSEDKVVKIWDLRSFLCIQTLVDKERRYPEDRFTTCTYDKTRQTIVTTSHVPVCWRDSEVQAKVETGVQWQEEYEGHLNPVIAIAFNEMANQVVSTDGEFVHVWSLHTGDCIGKWSTGSRITTLSFDSAQRRIITGSDSGKVEMWYYMNGKLLKDFQDCNFEVSSLLHLELTEGQSVMHTCIASGFSSLVPMWVDRPITTHEVATTKPFYVLNISSFIQGDVYAMAYVKPNRLALGTSLGDVLLFALNFMSPPQYLSCMSSDMFGLLRGAFLRNDRPRIHAIRDALPANSKWKRLLLTAEKEGTMSGAKEYTDFRCGVQRTLLVVTERIKFITEELILTLHGDGEAILWRVYPNIKYALEIVACFPASHAPASVALAACVDHQDGILYIGDSNGVLSLFDIRHILAELPEVKLPKVGKSPRSRSNGMVANRKSPSGRLYLNDAGVKYSRCMALPITSVTSMELLKTFRFLIVGSGCCSLVLVDTRSGTVMGKFGYDKSSLGNWPVFLAPGEVSEGRCRWKPPVKSPTRGHPERGEEPQDDDHNPYSILPHRFVGLFEAQGHSKERDASHSTEPRSPQMSPRGRSFYTPPPFSTTSKATDKSSTNSRNTKAPVPKRLGSLRKISISSATDEELPQLLEYYKSLPAPKESVSSALRTMRNRSTLLQNRPEPSYRMLDTKNPAIIPEHWLNVERSKKFETEAGE